MGTWQMGILCMGTVHLATVEPCLPVAVLLVTGEAGTSRKELCGGNMIQGNFQINPPTILRSYRLLHICRKHYRNPCDLYSVSHMETSRRTVMLCNVTEQQCWHSTYLPQASPSYNYLCGWCVCVCACACLFQYSGICVFILVCACMCTCWCVCTGACVYLFPCVCRHYISGAPRILPLSFCSHTCLHATLTPGSYSSAFHFQNFLLSRLLYKQNHVIWKWGVIGGIFI